MIQLWPDAPHPIVHRVIVADAWGYLTKGDNNEADDEAAYVKAKGIWRLKSEHILVRPPRLGDDLIE
jgi:hypothetical protein